MLVVSVTPDELVDVKVRHTKAPPDISGGALNL